MKRIMLCLMGVGALGAQAIGLQGCQESKTSTTTEAAPEIATRPIVNGQLETGYPAVGALTAWFGGQYGGSYCTGTLIRPDWVLTAAHCVADESSPNGTRFFIGSNALNPDSGDFYRALAFYVHEGYDDQFLEDDIALVRLQTPVTGVTPIAYNTANLSPYEGDTAFYVGFGATEGINETGSGVKRSTSFPITQVYSESFESAYNNTGTCFGDSGGPALLTINGTQVVVGVTSAGAACQGFNCDPCKTSTTSTRVDAYTAWIADKLDEPAPDCNDNPTICSCDEACQANGVCDNTQCQTLDCGAAYDCLVECGDDAACQERCLESASDIAQQQFNALATCIDQRCGGNMTDDQFATCVQQNCSDETDACFGPSVSGDDTCEQIYDCFGNCQDDACYQTCFEGGSSQAQGQINAMLSCFDDSCGTIENEDEWVACVQAQCVNELNACFGEAESCNVLGGDCEPGTACFPTTTEGFNGCFETAGKQVGAACDDASQDLECVDGAACLDGVCARFCTGNNQCGGDTCDLEIFGTTFGLCSAGGVEPTCTDNDGDGTCVDEGDCNDSDAAVHPGAAEGCGNSRDDNCNGQTDEGCSSCVDSDGDTICAPQDCNDNDPTVSPNATERCGDATDNNCNGQTDEGCSTCVDGDGDGFCANNGDCNDAAAGVHPTVVETCGNAIDDNCNGQTDESCTNGNPNDPNNPNNPNNPVPQGGNGSSGCAGGDGAMPLALALGGLALVLARRRRA